MPRLVYIEIDNTIQLVVKDWDGAKGSVVNGNWELIKSEFTHQYRSDDHEWKAYKTFEVTKVPSWLRNEDYNEIIEKMAERKNEKNAEQTIKNQKFIEKDVTLDRWIRMNENLRERLLRSLIPEGMSDAEGAVYLKENGVMFCSGPNTPDDVTEFHGFGEQLGYIKQTIREDELRLQFFKMSERMDSF